MRFFTSVAVLVMAVVVAGCTSAPIMNVDNAVSSASGKPLTQDQVRGAIIRAGTALGWQMKDEGPNKPNGTLMLRNAHGGGRNSLFSDKLQHQVPLQRQPG